jgi:putative two-component system response regulator
LQPWWPRARGPPLHPRWRDLPDCPCLERPYKLAWSLQEARAAIAEGSGTQFDPDCVAAFLRRWDAIVAVHAEAAAQPIEAANGTPEAKVALTIASVCTHAPRRPTGHAGSLSED